MLRSAYGYSKFEFDEENDLKNYTVWLCDFVHGVPAWKPLYLTSGWSNYLWGLQLAAETLHVPTTKGWDYRIIDGYCYPTIIETTQEEAKQREPIFRQKIRPYLEDFDGVWEPFKAEIMNVYKNLKRSQGIIAYGDIEKAENIAVAALFEDFIRIVNRREAEIHMLMMVPVYYIFGTFQQMWQEMFGTPSGIDPLFSTLMSGFEGSVFQMNKEAWHLGRQAMGIGIDRLFLSTDDNEQVWGEIKKSNVATKWLDEYSKFLDVYGWKCERMQDWATPTWLEKPSLGIPTIRMAIKTGGTYTLDETRQRVAKERSKAEEEVLGKVRPDQKEWFKLLMKGAQKAGYWSEDHTPYLDFYTCALGRWITRELGRRFSQAGSIDDAEDIYFLLPDEIRKGYITMEKVNLRTYVDRRKKEWEENLKKEPKPFYGNIEKAGEMIMKDPSISVSVQAPIVRPELKADLYGSAAAPGVVEGIARVVMTEKQLSEVQRGDILVAPGMSAPWTPVFEIIGGAITDGGGATSHPVIVAREYGIPCVVGCIEATKKIKTGDRVKLDGNLGVVYILKK
jgi:phosphoenolpyruvate synthase/pyruvate phosphate dikinase